MLDNLSVEEIQKNINNRQISIKEVLVYYLERIEKFNKDINAIVLQKDRELLIKEAEQKDNLQNNKITSSIKHSFIPKTSAISQACCPPAPPKVERQYSVIS